MEGYVELADAGYEVGDIADVPVVAAVEEVVVIVLFFSAFVQQALDWILGICEVSDCSEVDLQVGLPAA